MVARVLWEHLELVQVQLFRPGADKRLCQEERVRGLISEISNQKSGDFGEDYKFPAYIGEWCNGNTRGFEPLIISSSLVSPAKYK